MITKERNKSKYCCFYVSDFHLEMILLPYIKNNLLNSKITIMTEENLTDSIKILIEKVNLKGEQKENILKLNWNNKYLDIEENNMKKCIIINGSIDYIKNVNKKIQEKNIKNTVIIDCYNVNKNDVDIYKIKKEYDGVLNTEKI